MNDFNKSQPAFTVSVDAAYKARIHVFAFSCTSVQTAWLLKGFTAVQFIPTCRLIMESKLFRPGVGNVIHPLFGLSHHHMAVCLIDIGS